MHFVAASVRFEHSTYNVNESSTAQLVLILDKPLSIDFTIEVFATISGKLCNHTYSSCIYCCYHNMYS